VFTFIVIFTTVPKNTFSGDVKKQWKSAMKKYHPPPPSEMHLLPQSNQNVNNNSHALSHAHAGTNSILKPYQGQYGGIREEDEDFSSQSSYGSHKNRDFRSGSHGGSHDEDNYPEIYTREPRFAKFRWSNWGKIEKIMTVMKHKIRGLII
jgi:hypothetical protein